MRGSSMASGDATGQPTGHQRRHQRANHVATSGPTTSGQPANHVATSGDRGRTSACLPASVFLRGPPVNQRPQAVNHGKTARATA